MSRHKELFENKPIEGDILCFKDGGAAEPRIQRFNSEHRVFVNCAVDDEGTGWYLTAGDNGLKCLLSYDEREKFRSLGPKTKISSLRVVRVGQGHRSLICAIENFVKGETDE